MGYDRKDLIGWDGIGGSAYFSAHFAGNEGKHRGIVDISPGYLGRMGLLPWYAIPLENNRRDIYIHVV